MTENSCASLQCPFLVNQPLAQELVIVLIDSAATPAAPCSCLSIMSDTSPKLVLALPLFDALLESFTDASSETLSFAVEVAAGTVTSPDSTH
jgi:hypothetical protein